MRRLNRPITTQKLRLRITGSQATPCISEFSLFRQPAGAVRPSIFRRGDNLVIIADGKINPVHDGRQRTQSRISRLQPGC